MKGTMDKRLLLLIGIQVGQFVVGAVAQFAVWAVGFTGGNMLGLYSLAGITLPILFCFVFGWFRGGAKVGCLSGLGNILSFAWFYCAVTFVSLPEMGHRIGLAIWPCLAFATMVVSFLGWGAGVLLARHQERKNSK